MKRLKKILSLTKRRGKKRRSTGGCAQDVRPRKKRKSINLNEEALLKVGFEKVQLDRMSKVCGAKKLFRWLLMEVGEASNQILSDEYEKTTLEAIGAMDLLSALKIDGGVKTNLKYLEGYFSIEEIVKMGSNNGANQLFYCLSEKMSWWEKDESGEAEKKTELRLTYWLSEFSKKEIVQLGSHDGANQLFRCLSEEMSWWEKDESSEAEKKTGPRLTYWLSEFSKKEIVKMGSNNGANQLFRYLSEEMSWWEKDESGEAEKKTGPRLTYWLSEFSKKEIVQLGSNSGANQLFRYLSEKMSWWEENESGEAEKKTGPRLTYWLSEFSKKEIVQLGSNGGANQLFRCLSEEISWREENESGEAEKKTGSRLTYLKRVFSNEEIVQLGSHDGANQLFRCLSEEISWREENKSGEAEKKTGSRLTYLKRVFSNEEIVQLGSHDGANQLFRCLSEEMSWWEKDESGEAEKKTGPRLTYWMRVFNEKEIVQLGSNCGAKQLFRYLSEEISWREENESGGAEKKTGSRLTYWMRVFSKKEIVKLGSYGGAKQLLRCLSEEMSWREKDDSGEAEEKTGTRLDYLEKKYNHQELTSILSIRSVSKKLRLISQSGEPILCKLIENNWEIKHIRQLLYMIQKKVENIKTIKIEGRAAAEIIQELEGKKAGGKAKKSRPSTNRYNPY